MPLAVQTIAQPRMQRRVMKHFDGHDLPVLSAIPLAAINGAHAAVSKDGHEAIVSHSSADQPILMLGQQRLGRCADRVQQRVRRLLIRGKQRFDRAFKVCVTAAGIRESTRTLRERHVDHLVEERLNPLPPITRNHGAR
jgi:hypothetical protein